MFVEHVASRRQSGRGLVLRTAKLIALNSARRLGAYRAVRESEWRRDRLPILCYHGISSSDEHRWNPELYISPWLFEQRLVTIRDGGYNVLPLAKALSLLYASKLPPKSICITFDDGFFDFSAIAYPLLKKYGFPATVYLTSFYSQFQRPVFDVMCSYLLWQGRERTLDTTGISSHCGSVQLADASVRQALTNDLRWLAARDNYSAAQKDDLLHRLASRLGIDYAVLVASRVLQIMSAAEIGLLDEQLIQIELHTHRHRVPLNKETFDREILANRAYIRDATAGLSWATHFCYPSGVTSPAFLPWLDALGIASATTCRPGMADFTNDPLMLPRYLDTSSVSSVEFEGWLTGLASKMPRRAIVYPEPTMSGVLA